MPESTEAQPPAVDETPISPVRPDHGRKNSLENHLMHRPNRSELVDSECSLALDAVIPTVVPPHFGFPHAPRLPPLDPCPDWLWASAPTSQHVALADNPRLRPYKRTFYRNRRPLQARRLIRGR